MKSFAILIVLSLVSQAVVAADAPAPGTHAHYAVLTADWDGPAPFAAVDIVYGPKEQVRGRECQWWQMELRKENDLKSTPLMAIRVLGSRDPPGDASEPMRVERYVLNVPAAGQVLEYRDVHGGGGLLPGWKDFQTHFFPRRGRFSRRQAGVPETAALLGHTLTLQWVGRNVPWTRWEKTKRLDLDPELLVGTGRNFRDSEGHRLPQTPKRQNYTYVRFTREEYRVMIDAGINLYVVDPEQSTWIRDENVFYHRSAGGNPPLAWPADMYRSNYLGPVMFMDEPAIIMVGDRNVHDTLRYFSDAVNLLEQRVRFRYAGPGSYSAFSLERELQKAGVCFGDMRLEQCDYPAWETIYSTAHYQLEAGLGGIVHEGRYRLAEFDAALAKWDKPRKHTPEQMLRYHYAILRGAARANGKHWGTSIYGQAEEKHSPLAVTLAYAMGARYVWFWTSDHDHHLPWKEQLALTRTLKEHAAKHPRGSIHAGAGGSAESGRSARPTVDTAIVIPWGQFLELGDVWWLRALDKEGKNEYSQRFARLMRRAHAEIHAAMDRNEDYDVVVDTGKPVEGYRKVVRISDEP